MDVSKQVSFRVAEWHVDPASSRIIHDGKIIKLEPRVMDVLVYLASRPGQVATRDELEANV
jgi:transcriptional activator of cad operon